MLGGLCQMFNRWGESLIFAEKIEKAKRNCKEKPEKFNLQKVNEEQEVFDKFKTAFFNNLQLEIHEFENKYISFYNNMIKRFTTIVNDIKIEVKILLKPL